MIRKLLLISLLLMALTSRAQETLLPDSTLHLPSLNNLGQMHYINRWPMSYSLAGYQNWDLHQGLNMSLGASVFAGFGKYAPSGAGFAQNVRAISSREMSSILRIMLQNYAFRAILSKYARLFSIIYSQ